MLNIPSMSYHANTTARVAQNEDFRRVLFTGTKSQLVAMSIPPGGEVGEETHEHVEQILFIQSGQGHAFLNDEVFTIGPGDAIIVSPGTKHNFKNAGDEPLKIATVYSPPNHIDGRVHRTKAEADADEEDEAFGHAQQ
jgi:mannose-6-phosphate isomerase-like protein (cupin superfamily)